MSWLAFEVGKLWKSIKDGDACYAGRIELPYPLPAGAKLEAIFIPRPLRSPKWEMGHLCIEMPLIEPPPDHWPEDLHFKGERMSQFFRPAKPSNRRHKIFIWGASGSAKTKSALEFPACAYIDNHGSAEKYESAYPQHLFNKETATADNTMAAVTSLLGDPGDRRTLVLDDVTTYWEQVQNKWGSTFLSRLPKSPGHHAEFYTFQPSDWKYPKGELKSLVRRATALDMNVIVIGRAAKEYAGDGKDFMKVIGETFAGEKGLVYEFDYVFQFIHEAGESGGKYRAIVHKQRITPGEKPMPESFEFTIDKKGRSTFYDEFSKYVDKTKLNAESHGVKDPVQGETEEEKEVPAAQPPAGETDPGPNQVNAEHSPLDATAERPQSVGPAAAVTNPPTEKLFPITEDQLNQIVELKGRIVVSKEAWLERLQKYGVSTARDLSQEQGKDFIGVLVVLADDIPF